MSKADSKKPKIEMGKNSGKLPRDLALLIVQELGKQPRPAPDESADDNFAFDYQHGRDQH